MTAPDSDAPVDPVVCINARMVGEGPQCGEPEPAHCEKCRSCPNTCGCNTGWRYTFTVTPLTPAEAQQVIDDIRVRFGRKPLIHVISKQPPNTHVDNAPTEAAKENDRG